MASTAQIISRIIVLDNKGTKITLPDPNAGFSDEQVRQFYSGQHPEITNAAIEKGGTAHAPTLTFKTYAGTKG